MKRPQDRIFHLAIPCRDLDKTSDFYSNKIGCRVARRYHDRVTLDFFGDQVVCHLSPENVPEEPEFYPRHFGFTFWEREVFDDFYNKAKDNDVPFFREITLRFEGKREQHLFFVLRDPSNNLIEAKYYYDPEMAY